MEVYWGVGVEGCRIVGLLFRPFSPDSVSYGGKIVPDHCMEVYWGVGVEGCRIVGPLFRP